VIFDINLATHSAKVKLEPGPSMDIKKEGGVVSGLGMTNGKRCRDNELSNTNNAKRLRLDEEPLKEEIFKIFASQDEDSLTLKQLNQTLQQPEKYLKDVLSTICDVQRKNVNRYSLKPEYKRM
jgi:hypothetical protein